MKNPILFILLTLFTLCAFGFLYTFIQPRYTATIVRVGRSRIITHSTKHGRSCFFLFHA